MEISFAGWPASPFAEKNQTRKSVLNGLNPAVAGANKK